MPITLTTTQEIDERGLLRTGGIGALVGSAAYGALPLVQTVAAGGTFGSATTANGLIDPGRVETLGLLFWVISLGSVLFGLGTLAVVVSTARIVFARLGSVGALAVVAVVAGIIASAAWISYGALTRSMAGRAAGSIADTGADLASQQAAYQVLNAVGIGLLIAGGVTTAVWLVGLATFGRRARLVGWGWSACALVVAAILLVGLWVLAVPPAHLLLIPFYLLFGIALLVKSAHAPRSVA